MTGDRLLPPRPLVEIVGYEERVTYEGRAPATAGPPRACLMSDCDQTARSCGWCYAHCNVLHRHVPAQQCSVEGCSRRHKGRGWCHTHYMRWRRNGDPLRPAKPLPSTAEVRAEMREALARVSGEVAE